MAAKYDKIGIDYNSTRKADFYLTEQLIKHLKPTKSGIYLDIGCGTGNYTHKFQKKGFQFTGIDPSIEMLNKAISKNPLIDWKVATAEETGLPDNYVDGITAFLTLHHWTDLNKGFLELSRVLKASGRIVVFTSTPKQMKGYWLNHYFPKMMSDSMIQMPTLPRIKMAMQNAGIQLLETEDYFIKPDLKDQFLYCGKQNPKLYFDPQIRQGISSFSSLANQTEVKQGLSQLRLDIGTGRIKAIMKTYENSFGDYIFIIGEKSENKNL